MWHCTLPVTVYSSAYSFECWIEIDAPDPGMELQRKCTSGSLSGWVLNWGRVRQAQGWRCRENAHLGPSLVECWIEVGWSRPRDGAPERMHIWVPLWFSAELRSGDPGPGMALQRECTSGSLSGWVLNWGRVRQAQGWRCRENAHLGPSLIECWIEVGWSRPRDGAAERMHIWGPLWKQRAFKCQLRFQHKWTGIKGIREEGAASAY